MCPPSSEKISETAPTKSARILVVEDEQIVAMNLREKLQSMGYTVPALAASGEEAVTLVDELRPDLVLMDIHLDGDMDGVEAAQLIRNRLRIPVVYLTAYSTQEIIERAKVTEPFGYILKPYIVRELQVIIEMALYRSQIESKLLEQSRLLNATLQSIGDGVIATDNEGRINFLNPMAEHLTGWSLAEVRGRSIREILTIENDLGQTRRLPIDRAMQEKTSVPLEKDSALVSRNQQRIPIDDMATPIIDDNTLLGGVMVFRDVTHLRKLEEEFRQAQKMESIGRLAGGVAHEFNNLLTIINGFTEMVVNSLDFKDSRRELLGEVSKAGQRAASLTSQLLAYSRKSMLQPKLIELNELITANEKLFRHLLGESIRFQFLRSAQRLPLKVDPNHLVQALMNLIVNARDAMPSGGDLILETTTITLDASSPLFGHGLRPGPYGVLTIRDTGCGMDPQTLSHLFEPFFTTKEVGKGTGLGLSMVYGTVKQSGGHLEVESLLGKGTTFRIYLPLSDSPLIAEPKTGLEDLPRGTETILLVENEEGVRKLTACMLEQVGYSVLQAADGLQGLEVIAHHKGPIHLVVSDVVMPQMNGPQMIQTARSIYPHLRVLFQSGYDTDTLRSCGLKEKEEHLIHKPFTLASLVRKVRQVLDAHQSSEMVSSAGQDLPSS